MMNIGVKPTVDELNRTIEAISSTLTKISTVNTFRSLSSSGCAQSRNSKASPALQAQLAHDRDNARLALRHFKLKTRAI
ncbi:hypothetical protein [Flavihumibacter petaseus]|uniref:Uncharacterized protein n=1 Tax=Flavihumibacter petaseus NBRC 106054 TaxID=1220578 RepID=A0A0E9N4L7_9BACT|nr:hypothetical protein [Flavihumibacter petaseus]GAO44743.1 hypothetical protein FPE01S_03_07820 [Flavihumibacter petaseus NBRC 106054]